MSDASLLPWHLPHVLGTPAGAASGTYAWSAAATGTKTKSGATTGTYTWTAAAAGTHGGAGSGTYSWTAAPTGTKAPQGHASGTYGWTAAAAGTETTHGAASGTYTWTAAAAGVQPLLGIGTSHGTYSWTGAASGVTHPQGTASDTYRWTALATSWNPVEVLPALTPLGTLQQQLDNTADVQTATAAAEQLAQIASNADPTWIITVYDQFWNPIGDPGDDVIEHSGTDPRNNLPSATLKLKGSSPLIDAMMNCRTTLVGVTFETGGMRLPFYVDTFDYEYEKGAWIGTANLLGIWDILNYLVIWPDWYLPIQAQLFTYAIYLWALCTVIENMIAEQAIRIQLGLWEFVDNALSLNPDIRAWFGALLESNGNVVAMLKTPCYVVRTNPFLDTSPLFCRTVRMETCGSVIKDITKAYGVDVRVDLWLPGDPQPDTWAGLTQPTYVISVLDRSQITGPTKTVLDSVLRTVVDLEGSLLGHVLDPLLNPNAEYSPENVFIAPTLGVNFVQPWVIFIAPDEGMSGSVQTCKISCHTPKGWQHIIGGRSPKWLNDFINSCFSWIIDAITIVVGIGGIPSDLLSGFLNNAFLAFQLIENFDRRNTVGPYHPAIEVFHATTSPPYSIETEFAFINALWDSRGWACAQTGFRNGEVYTYGKDIFRGSLASVVYMNRTMMLTDYVEHAMWRCDAHTRDLIVQVGDGKAKESPLAKHQRFLTAALESINVLTLSPQSG